MKNKTILLGLNELNFDYFIFIKTSPNFKTLRKGF
jgi:hypothetical protein